MTRRAAVLTSVAIALFAPAAVARAQAGDLQLRAASTGDVRADAGAVVTAVFTVRNAGRDSLHATPAIAVPRGWSVVMGSTPLTLAPGAGDTWLVGVSIPSGAPAEPYVVRASLKFGGAVVSDSIEVRVNERRAVDVLLIDTPGWVVAGARYESRFVVRNRGNVTSTFSLAGSTSRGTRCETTPSSLTLGAGASAVVTVRVAMANTFDRTTDDVAELSVVDVADASVRGTATTRTTVVSADGDSRFATIPATLSLRSIGGASGVSPVAFT
ncbi:MAG TPA: NEW3 domain-containing protein, partial [Gemmatimonadaceae bacterium]|nr:NEW3 domain-containing protein [Gemmatimonadaceae bacterium]